MIRSAAIVLFILFYTASSQAQKNSAKLEGKTFRVYYWVDHNAVLKDSAQVNESKGAITELLMTFSSVKNKMGCRVRYGVTDGSNDSCTAFFEIKESNHLTRFTVPETVKEADFDPCRGHTDYSDLVYATFGKGQSYTMTVGTENIIISDAKNNTWIRLKKCNVKIE